MAHRIPRDSRRPRPGPRCRALGEPSFLCPVCAAPLLGNAGLCERPCEHVLLVCDGSGAIRYRDTEVLRSLAAARRQVGRGGDVVEALRARLGRDVVVVDLLASVHGATGAESVTFLVNLASAR